MGSGARAARAGPASASPAKAPEPVTSARAPAGTAAGLNFPRRSPGSRAFTGTISAALPDILNPDRDGYHDTNPDAAAMIGDLAEPAP